MPYLAGAMLPWVGTIYGSPTTCALVKLKLGVKSNRLHPLEMEKKHTILCKGFPVEVTLTEANHCPGAVCIIFSFADGKVGRVVMTVCERIGEVTD